MESDRIPTFADVRAAADRIAGEIRRTPSVRFDWLGDAIGADVFLKCEHLQVGGAFKFRGACNAILALDDATAKRGIATHSSGNHGAAVALAAKRRGSAAYVVVPTTCAEVKLKLIQESGAIVTFCEPTVAAREAAVAAIVAKTGATLVHPYDDALVIAGQGTATLELMADVPDLDALVVPISGGGLMSGSAIAAHGVDATVEMIGAEPELAGDAAESLRTGTLMPSLPTSGQTIADGLRAALCPRTYEIIRSHVKDVITVSEAEIVATMTLVRDHAGMTIEPSAAVAIAAVMRQADRFKGRRVGVIVTGGNVDIHHGSTETRRENHR